MTGRKRGVAEVLEDIGEENASSCDETPSKQRRYGTGDSGMCSTKQVKENIKKNVVLLAINIPN